MNAKDFFSTLIGKPTSVKSQFFFKGTIMAEFDLTYIQHLELMITLNSAETNLSKIKLNQIYKGLEKIEARYVEEEKQKGYYTPVEIFQNVLDINLLLKNGRIKNDDMFGTIFLNSYK